MDKTNKEVIAEIEKRVQRKREFSTSDEEWANVYEDEITLLRIVKERGEALTEALETQISAEMGEPFEDCYVKAMHILDKVKP